MKIRQALKIAKKLGKNPDDVWLMPDHTHLRAIRRGGRRYWQVFVATCIARKRAESGSQTH